MNIPKITSEQIKWSVSILGKPAARGLFLGTFQDLRAAGFSKGAARRGAASVVHEQAQLHEERGAAQGVLAFA